MLGGKFDRADRMQANANPSPQDSASFYLDFLRGWVQDTDAVVKQLAPNETRAEVIALLAETREMLNRISGNAFVRTEQPEEKLRIRVQGIVAARDALANRIAQCAG
jgi:hypothetical protein